MDILLRYAVEVRDLLSHHPMFAVGILLLAGFGLGKAAARVRLPEITGYIVAGVLMGESVTGIFPPKMGESFTIVTEIALGLIALTIGSEFSAGKLKCLGRGVIVITVAQIALTFLAVSVALMALGMEWPFALLLGAIASATAPAATVAIVRSLRARGLFVDYLYGVVALDDAGCVILFGTVFAVVSSAISVTSGAVGSGGIMIKAFGEVFLSISIGVANGFLLHVATRRRQGTNEILILALGFTFLSTALCIVLHLSPLLMNMAAGCMLINLSARNHRIFKILEPLTPPLYALFFVIAGAALRPSIITEKEALLFGCVYIVFRAMGKYGGVYLGAAISGTPARIRNYLGVCMLPQAGVAIGLVLLIQTAPLMQHVSPEHAAVIGDMVNIVLLSVFVNELIGPPLSKLAIIRGNEMEA